MWAADTYSLLIQYSAGLKNIRAILVHTSTTIFSMLSISLLRPSNALISLFGLFVGVKLIQFVVKQVRSSRLPRLKGPSNNNLIFGRLREVLDSKDRAATYQSWSEEYGAVFQIPAMMGGRRIILCDSKAIVHLHSKDTFTYHGLPFSKKFMKKFVSRYESGHGVIYKSLDRWDLICYMLSMRTTGGAIV